MADSKKSHIDKIDVLRGIAVLGVFLYHSQIAMFDNCHLRWYNPDGKIEASSIRNIILNFSPIAFGWSCVELFLLISGFLIHLGYLSSTKTFSVQEFYSKRFWRIYPPYLLALIFFLFVREGLKYYLLQKWGILDLLTHLFLVHNLSNRTFWGINGSFWSLALEMQLYWLYPIFLYIRKKIGINKTFLLSLFMSFIVLGVGILSGLIQYRNYSFFVLKLWFVWAAGALLAEKYFNREKIFGKHVKLIIICFFILSILSIAFSSTNNLTEYLVTITWLAFFEWLLYTNFVNTTSSIFKLVSTIGACSYSIYLIHQPLLKNMYDFFNTMTVKSFGQLNVYLKLINIIPVFLIIFLISYSLYIFVELPSISLGKYYRDKKASRNNHKPNSTQSAS